jgi:hypothetical protein
MAQRSSPNLRFDGSKPSDTGDGTMLRTSAFIAMSAAAAAAGLAAGFAVNAASASAFWPGTVIAITPVDTLKVRKWPSSISQIIDAYALNANVSLTGRCKNIVTNVSFRIDGPQSVNWKYNRMKQPNVWCQVMTDAPSLGWVRGKFVWPQ